MITAYWIIFFVLLGYSRCGLTQCADPPTSMIATENFVDLFGGNIPPAILETSDNGVIMAGLYNGLNIIRAVKLNQKGKLEWSKLISVNTSGTGRAISIVEDNSDPLNIFLVFQAAIIPPGELQIFTYLSVCDMATCTNVKTKSSMSFSGSYSNIYMQSFLKVQSTKKIYSLGTGKTLNSGYRVLLAEYNAADTALKGISQTSFSDVNSLDKYPSISFTPSGSIIILFYSPIDETQSKIAYYEFDQNSFSSHKSSYSYLLSITSLTQISPIYISGKLYIVASNKLYSLTNSNDGITLIDGTYNFYSGARGMSDSDGILTSFYESYGKVFRIDPARNCLYKNIKDTAILNYIFSNVIQSYDKTFYWITGYTYYNPFLYGVFIFEYTIAIKCLDLIPYKNQQCLPIINSQCAAACYNSCLKQNDFNACYNMDDFFINILNNGRYYLPEKLFVNGVAVPLVTSGCSSLCGGMCSATNDNTRCALYCSALIEGIDDREAGGGICKCTTGYKIGTANPICVKNKGCKDICDYGECNAAGLCASCKNIAGMVKKQIGNFYECDCISILSKQGQSICAHTSSKCHPFCSGKCTKENCPNSCYGCNASISYLLEKKTFDVSSCSCASPRIVKNGLCVLNSNCGKNCNGLCLIANDNTKCVGGCDQGISADKIKNNGDGTVSCVSLDVDLKLQSDIINMDRCKGVEFVATVTPADKALTTKFLWAATYANPSIIPSAFTTALAKAISSTSSILSISYDALFPGINLIVTITATESSIANPVIKSYTLAIPKSSNIYCGPCQLDNRVSCARLNGNCWKDYNNVTETKINNESSCLAQMASECYKIWSSNVFRTDEPQCKQFQQIFNTTLMSKKATIINATQVHNAQAIITVIFDTDTNPKTAQDCPSLLTADTLQGLSFSSSCKWKTLREYEIAYSPEKEYITTIRFKGGNIFTNYPYSMESMDATAINVPSPQLTYTFGLISPKTVSCSSPLLLKAQTTPGKPVTWIYAWIISYQSGNFTSDQAVAANGYFQTLINWNSNNQAISIPAKFLYPNSVLKIVLNSKHQYNNSTYYAESLLNIIEDSIGSDLSSKSSITNGLYGKKKNNIEISIMPTNLFQKGTGLSNNSQSNSSSAISANNGTGEITFEVRRGNDPNNMTIRGGDEIIIEQALNLKFKSLKLLSLSSSSYFKYYTYYNVTMIIQSRNSSQESSGVLPPAVILSSSSFMVYLTKQAPLCIITTPGFLIDPSKDNTFSSKKSILDNSAGDEVLYNWNCESCINLISNNSCSCDIFTSPTQRQGYEITIYSGFLNSASRYVISVSIIVKTGENSMSCYTTTEVVAMNGASSGLAASEVSGGISGSSKDSGLQKSEIYQGLDFDKSQLSKNVTKIKWDLIEVKNKTTGKVIGSIKDSYLKQLLKSEYNVGINTRRELQSADLPIPSDYIPNVITASSNYPPIIGIDQSGLKANMRYTYAATISYSEDSIKSAVGTVNFDSGADLLQRDIAVYPDTGYAYTTVFTFSFDTVAGTQQEGTMFILYRSDCWDGPSVWQNSSDYKRISTNLKNINSFSTILSPGLQACNYQVKIMIFVTLGGKWKELKTIVKVLPSNADMKNQKIAILASLSSNASQVSLIQSLTILSQISQNNDQTNDNAIDEKIISLVSNFDTTLLNDILNALDADELSGFIEILVEILKSIISSNYSIVSKEMAAIIINKLQMYCRIAVDTLSNGDTIISALLSGFSSILALRDYNVNMFPFENSQNLIIKKSQIDQIVTTIYQLAELKLKGVLPVGKPYTVTIPNIGMSLNSTNLMVANASNYNLSIANKNQSFAFIPFPYNLSLSTTLQQSNQLYVLTTMLLSISATPMNDIKKFTVIDTKSLDKNILANGKINSETMKQIYDDLRTTNKLDSYVNSQQVNNQNLFFGVFLSNYDTITGQTKIATNVSLSNIIKEVAFGIILSQSTANDFDSPRIPLFYQANSGIWTNQGCFIDNQTNNYTNFTNIPIAPLLTGGSLQQLAIIRCNWTNLTFTGLNSSNIVQVAVDSFKDFKNLVIVNGYPSSFDDGFGFTKLKAASYIILFGGIIFFVIVAVFFIYYDKGMINKAHIEALSSHFEKQKILTCTEETVMGRLSNFLIEIKNKSYYFLFIRDRAKLVSEPDIASPRKSEMENDLKQAPNDNEASPGSKAVSDNLKVDTIQPHIIITVDQKDEKELFDLYTQTKKESCGETKNKPNINNSPILYQITASFLEDRILAIKGTMWGFIKSTHLLLSLFFTLSIYCTRSTRLLIFGSVIIGQLFLTATFFDFNDSIQIDNDKIKFVRVMFGSVFFAIGITIVLKLALQLFMKGKIPQMHMTKSETDKLYSQNTTFYYNGLVTMIAWAGICIWRVVTYTNNFNDTAMTKWLYTFLCCILVDIFVMEILKIILKLGLNLLCMRAAKGNQQIHGNLSKKIAQAASNFYFYFT